MRYLIPLLAIVLAVPGCGPGRTTSDRDLTILDTDEVAHAMEEHAPVVFVDVRNREAYEAGHLPDAIHMPLPEMAANDDRLTEARTIIVYGRGAGSRLAAAGAKKLIRLGYTGVAEFRGGIEAWEDDGDAD